MSAGTPQEPCPHCGFMGPYDGHVCEQSRCECGDPENCRYATEEEHGSAHTGTPQEDVRIVREALTHPEHLASDAPYRAPIAALDRLEQRLAESVPRSFSISQQETIVSLEQRLARLERIEEELRFCPFCATGFIPNPPDKHRDSCPGCARANIAEEQLVVALAAKKGGDRE